MELLSFTVFFQQKQIEISSDAAVKILTGRRSRKYQMQKCPHSCCQVGWCRKSSSILHSVKHLMHKQVSLAKTCSVRHCSSHQFQTGNAFSFCSLGIQSVFSGGCKCGRCCLWGAQNQLNQPDFKGWEALSGGARLNFVIRFTKATTYRWTCEVFYWLVSFAPNCPEWVLWLLSSSVLLRHADVANFSPLSFPPKFPPSSLSHCRMPISLLYNLSFGFD